MHVRPIASQFFIEDLSSTFQIKAVFKKEHKGKLKANLMKARHSSSRNRSASRKCHHFPRANSLTSQETEQHTDALDKLYTSTMQTHTTHKLTLKYFNTLPLFFLSKAPSISAKSIERLIYDGTLWNYEGFFIKSPPHISNMQKNVSH